jgi:hypothetical protein
MKKAVISIIFLLVICAALWLGERNLPDGSLSRKQRTAKAYRSRLDDSSEEPGITRTKRAIRAHTSNVRTHSPERLREFMMPLVEIEGLALEPALQKLMATYRDACLKAGETALPLTFSIPPNANRKLNVRLRAQNFSVSVGILAALSGAKMERRGLEYRFELIADEHKAIKKTLPVPSNFASRLVGMGHEVPDPADPFAESMERRPIREAFAELGLELDPSTRLSLGASGELIMESSSAGDTAVITALTRLLAERNPAQMKHETKVLQLPADTNWSPPDSSVMDDAQVQMLMRKLAVTKGTTLTTLSSVTNKSEQSATIEIVREVSYPTDFGSTEFESRNVGVVLDVKGSLIGFGGEMDFKFSHTELDGMDPANEKPVIRDVAKLSDSGYSDDGSTRYSIQAHADGSKTLVLMTSKLIDATGRPIR